MRPEDLEGSDNTLASKELPEIALSPPPTFYGIPKND